MPGIDARQLLPIKQWPNFILLISPMIITFVLFLAGGNGITPAPGGMWLVSMMMIQMLVLVLKKGGISMLKRKPEGIVKMMNPACGIFSVPYGNGHDLTSKPSERLIFHFFTIVYLITHVVVAKLEVEEIIMPSIFILTIAMLSFGDVYRLKKQCFHGGMDVAISALIGVGGGGLAFATGAIIPDKAAVFFSKNKQCPR
tara:strand:- start:417 stop:1013 length:597 start_codon:yes stop_codon:yes gene_type:complete